MNSTGSTLKTAFKGKRVLVTGHTGFKGSWLSIWLNELGAEVIGYALDPYTERDNYPLSGISKHIIDIRADIRNFDNLGHTFQQYSPEYVFHLAAQSLVRDGYERPKETYEVNVGGTVNLLETCRNSKSVKVIINVTSDKCYKNREWIWGYREIDPIGGYDPYSSSKGCSELITTSYRNSFFNPKDFKNHKKSLSSVRAGNVIGGGDWAKNRIIPDCIRDLEKGKPIKIRNPQATRPWQYVLELLGGYLYLAAHMDEDPSRYSGAWNFGPESSSIHEVQEIVELVIKNWGSGKWVKFDESNKPHEAGLLSLDISKARYELGWLPFLNIHNTVTNTVNWYKTNQSHGNILNFCKNQVITYMENMQTK